MSTPAKTDEVPTPEILRLLQGILELSDARLAAADAAIRQRDEGIAWLRGQLNPEGTPEQAAQTATVETTDTSYAEKLAIESRKWGSHLQLEASGHWHSWLCHPIIQANYEDRTRLDGLVWQEWIGKFRGGPARRSLDLGCGSGGTSLRLHASGSALRTEGYDLSEARIAEAERRRMASGIEGSFRVADVNRLTLPAGTYDLIVSKESFHHFLELERIMEQVHEALTPDGLFILEEFTGPSQFQWTNLQMLLVQDRLARLPELLRVLPWGAVKTEEGRPAPSLVEAESPFESIRSAEIVPLFHQYFDIVAVRKLGGTIQQLLYNGIVHNFTLDDRDAVRQVEDLCALENLLIDRDVIPSNFTLLVGRRKATP